MEVIINELSVYNSSTVGKDIQNIINSETYNAVFVMFDSNTFKHCSYQLEGILPSSTKIIIEAGEKYKNLDTVLNIWNNFEVGGATRKSLLINVGGGVLCDIGGFAASTFKRGFDFINVPTTLLSQVDASIGGKTGFNFNGLKNEIGVFSNPKAVLINTDFTKTQDLNQIKSGYGEMLKHTLISSKESFDALMQLDTNSIKSIDFELLKELTKQSNLIKYHYVKNDPREKGIRKALNLGHTIGHAIESWCLTNKCTISHGHAVAIGLVAELYLSQEYCGLDKKLVSDIKDAVYLKFDKVPLKEDNYSELLSLMKHDKKNTGSDINFSLLTNIGEIKIDNHCSQQSILEALNFALK